MGWTTKGWTLGCAIAGAVALSQFPEFAQQYRQHLAGGLGELQEVVSQFDEDAKGEGLTREEALETLAKSEESLPRERAQSMQNTFDRYEGLLDQWSNLRRTEPVFHPYYILQYPDTKILNGTWEIFKPAVPIVAEAAVWGGIGAFIGVVLGRLPVFAYRRRRKIKNENALEESVQNNA